MSKELRFRDIVKTKFSLPDAGWLLVNFLPLVFFLTGSISAIQAFLIYIAETVIVGIYNTVRLAVTAFIKRNDKKQIEDVNSIQSGWFFVFFFIAHFGFFVFVQFTIFMNAAKLTDGFSIVENFSVAWKLLGKEGQLFVYLNMAILFINGGLNYIREKEYENKSMGVMMFEPYLRIFVQQFTVILGAMFLNFGIDGAFIVVFMLAKIFFTCFLDERVFLSEISKKTPA